MVDFSKLCIHKNVRECMDAYSWILLIHWGNIRPPETPKNICMVCWVSLTHSASIGGDTWVNFQKGSGDWELPQMLMKTNQIKVKLSLRHSKNKSLVTLQLPFTRAGTHLGFILWTCLSPSPPQCCQPWNTTNTTPSRIQKCDDLDDPGVIGEFPYENRCKHMIFWQWE